MWLLTLLLLAPLVVSDSPKNSDGQDIDIEDRPFQVGLDGRAAGICGGSIVGERFVLTAAHCLEWASPITVHAGSARPLNGSVISNVTQSVLHPRHNGVKYLYDAVLLEINGHFDYNGKIQPVTLASRAPSPGDEVVVSGWNQLLEAPYRLQKASKVVVDLKTCEETIGAPAGSLTEAHLCTISGKNPCFGSGGDPLTDSSGRLVGFVSGVYLHDSDEKRVCIYTSVAAIHDWVEETIRSFPASTGRSILRHRVFNMRKLY